MKRTISILLTVLLVATTAVLLVACDGGIKSEEDWNKAMDLLTSCDAITLKMDEKKVQGTGLDKTTYKTTSTTSYDAKNGMLNYYEETSPYSAFGSRRYTSYKDEYFIVEGNEIKIYSLSWTNDSEKEKQTNSEHYDSAEAAALALRDKYLEYLRDTNIANLTYSVFAPAIFGGKYSSDGNICQVTFSGGKLTKYHFSDKIMGSTNSLEQTVTVKYKAKISLPNEVVAA